MLTSRFRISPLTLCVLALNALLLARCALFVFWGAEGLNSDSAVVGLMAKHIAEGSDFPVFIDGQRYLLAISAWLAAPVFRVFGASPWGLRLPMLLLNLLTGNLLFYLGVTEARLSPGRALACALIFAIPSFACCQLLMDPSDNALEPLLFSLLVWVCRRRPSLLGAVVAVGLLNRPFVLYAVAALGALEALRWWRARAPGAVAAPFPAAAALIRYAALALGSFLPAYAGISYLGRFSANHFGDGAPVSFFSKTWIVVLEDLRLWFGDSMPATLGLRAASVHERWAGHLHFSLWGGGLTALGLVALFRCLRGREPARGMPGGRYALFLVLTGLFSIAGYALFSPPTFHVAVLRYTSQVLLLLAGLYTLELGRSRAPRLAAAAFLALLCGTNAYFLLKDGAEQVALERRAPTAALARALLDRRLTVGRADFWQAYRLSFLSGEAIRMTPTTAVRFRQYERAFAEAPPQRKFELRPEPCAQGFESESGWVCALRP